MDCKDRVLPFAMMRLRLDHPQQQSAMKAGLLSAEVPFNTDLESAAPPEARK
jgi:hypothetical protein